MQHTVQDRSAPLLPPTPFAARVLLAWALVDAVGRIVALCIGVNHDGLVVELGHPIPSLRVLGSAALAAVATVGLVGFWRHRRWGPRFFAGYWLLGYVLGALCRVSVFFPSPVAPFDELSELTGLYFTFVVDGAWVALAIIYLRALAHPAAAGDPASLALPRPSRLTLPKAPAVLLLALGMGYLACFLPAIEDPSWFFRQLRAPMTWQAQFGAVQRLACLTTGGLLTVSAVALLARCQWGRWLGLVSLVLLAIDSVADSILHYAFYVDMVGVAEVFARLDRSTLQLHWNRVRPLLAVAAVVTFLWTCLSDGWQNGPGHTTDEA